MNRFMMIFLASALISSSGAYAQSASIDVSAAGAVDASSMLYGLDVALDRIRIALSGGADAKARAGLQIAEERLTEAKKAEIENDKNARERASKAYTRTIASVEANANAIEVAGAASIQSKAAIVASLERLEKESEMYVKADITSSVLERVRASFDADVESARAGGSADVDANVAIGRTSARTSVRIGGY